MGFHEFNQNNSGGDFLFDEDRGISHLVIVEADSVEEANRRAEGIGLYFDGCSTGQDCPCCGDRWSEAWAYGDTAETGDPVPSHYGRPLVEYPSPDAKWGPMRWMGDKPDAYVHLKDGRFFGFILTKDGQYVYDGKAGDIPEALPTSAPKEIES